MSTEVMASVTHFPQPQKENVMFSDGSEAVKENKQGHATTLVQIMSMDSSNRSLLSMKYYMGFMWDYSEINML